MSPFAVVATPDDSLHRMFQMSVVYSNDTWWANCVHKCPVQPQVVFSGILTRDFVCDPPDISPLSSYLDTC